MSLSIILTIPPALTILFFMQQKTMLIDKMIKHQSPQKYNSTVNQIGADRDPFFTVCPAFSLLRIPMIFGPAAALITKEISNGAITPKFNIINTSYSFVSVQSPIPTTLNSNQYTSFRRIYQPSVLHFYQYRCKIILYADIVHR